MDRETEDLLEALFLDSRVNAILGWALLAVFALAFVESALDRDLQWVAFTVGTAAIVLVPPVTHRSSQVMLPWELLAIASIPVLVRTVEVSLLANTFATYLAIAALALLVTTELHVLSRMRVTHWFAIGLVVFATLAVAGAWTIVRWNLDRYLGTAYLVDNETLMVEFVWVTLAGLVGGVLFDLYFRQRTRRIRSALGGVMRR